MAGFDPKWFNQLRALSRDKVLRIQSPRMRPSVYELRNAGILRQTFVDVTDKFAKGLFKYNYPMSPEFRVHDERHIYTFPTGRSFKRQWNVGFYAGETASEDYMRIGLGFRLNRHYEPEGLDEFTDFLGAVVQRQKDFDRLMKGLGNYTEPTFKKKGSLAQAVLADQPDFEDDWRFYGKRLRPLDRKDLRILSSIDLLAEECANIFDQIKQSGFK
jgi:hypothetical protein